MLRGGEASAEEEEEADRPEHDRRAHELRAPDPHRLRRDARGPAAVGVHAGADAVEGSERQRQEQRVIAPQGMRKSLETQSLISWHSGRNPSAPPPLHTKHLSPRVPRIPLIPSGAGQLQHPGRRSAFRSRVPTRTLKFQNEVLGILAADCDAETERPSFSMPGLPLPTGAPCSFVLSGSRVQKPTGLFKGSSAKPVTPHPHSCQTIQRRSLTFLTVRVRRVEFYHVGSRLNGTLF